MTGPECLQPGPRAGDSRATSEDAGTPGTLVALIVVAGVHIVVNAAIFLLGVATRNPAALFGGLASAGMYIAIVLGLIKMQEWARLMIIWLAYVGIVFSLGLFAFLEVPTLILAHWPSVRDATKGASLAKAYTYHEHPHQKGERAE